MDYSATFLDGYFGSINSQKEVKSSKLISQPNFHIE